MLTARFISRSLKLSSANCLITNEASARVLQESGFKHVGIKDELMYWVYKGQ